MSVDYERPTSPNGLAVIEWERCYPRAAPLHYDPVGYELSVLRRVRRFIAAMAVAMALMLGAPSMRANQVMRVGEMALIQRDSHSAEPPTRADRTLPAPPGWRVEVHLVPALDIVFAKATRQRARDGPC